MLWTDEAQRARTNRKDDGGFTDRDFGAMKPRAPRDFTIGRHLRSRDFR